MSQGAWSITQRRFIWPMAGIFSRFTVYSSLARTQSSLTTWQSGEDSLAVHAGERGDGVDWKPDGL